jgi:tRNA pseudouridine38-40 synthase
MARILFRMNRYFIEFSFKGTSYHGWQKQPNATTVQLMLEDSLATLTGTSIKTTGAGRTDTGVHARHFTAHFDSDHAVFQQGGIFIYKINCILPRDISVINLYRVQPDAHARFSALSRTYEYIIHAVKSPFDTELSWYFPKPLDLQSMNLAAAKLTAYTDFTSFCKLNTDVKTNLCHVSMAFWREEEGKLLFRVQADRFLRNMVRALVGTMVRVGLGKLSLEEFQAIFEARDRNLAGSSAPAEGLYLIDIVYPAYIRL